MSEYKSGSHNRYLLQYHLVLVCKFRLNLLVDTKVINDIERLTLEYSKKHKVCVHYMNTDKNHIHYMIETTPNINLSNYIKGLKSYTTYHIWRLYDKYLNLYFKKEKTFWSDGYFISSIGNVSSKNLENYIRNQGYK